MVCLRCRKFEISKKQHESTDAMARRAEKTAETYRSGQQDGPMSSKEIVHGISVMQSQERNDCGACVVCRSLEDLKDVFQSSVHSGRALARRRAVYPKPADTAYCDLTKQNKFLVKSVFHGKGNYLYHCDCIRGVFGVSNQHLSQLRKVIQIETSVLLS